MLFQLIVTFVEKLVNQAIRLSPALANELEAVKNKKLQLQIRDWQQNLVLQYTGEKLLILAENKADSQHSADCMISASIETLLELKDPAKITKLIREEKLDLEGDLKLAQSYSSALSKLEIDWLAHLSPYFGDGLSYRMLQGIELINAQQHKLLDKFKAGVIQTLQDELMVTIHPIEMSIFKEQNRNLQSAQEQVAQRVERLKQRLHHQNNNKG